MTVEESGLPGIEFLYTQLGAAESFDDLALRAVRVCARKAHAEMCTFWSVYEEDLYEKKGKSRRLRLAGAAGVSQIQTVAQEVTYAIGEMDGGRYDGLTGFVATSRLPLRIRSFQELKSDYGFCHRGALDGIQWENQAASRFRNLYAIPLTLGNEVLGVLKVENRVDGEMFTPEDIAAVDAIGSAIAVIAKTMELLDTHERRLIDIPAQLSEALLRPFDTIGLTKQIVQTTAKALNAKVCSLWLVHPDGYLVHEADVGFAGKPGSVPKYHINLPADVKDEDIEGITAWVAIRGKPFWANSHSQLRTHKSWRGQWDDQMWGGKEQAKGLFHSMYAAPLIWNKQVRGVLKVENPVGKAYFRPADHRMCDLMANYVALLLVLTQQLRLQVVPDWAHILKSPAVHIKTALSSLDKELARTEPRAARVHEFIDMLKGSAAALWELSYTISAEIKSADVIKEAVPTELVGIIEANLDTLRPLVPSGVRIDFTPAIAPKLKLTDSEGYWVRVILFNLIHNAVKFSPANGTVNVTCEQDPGGRIVIAVRDRGKGIPVVDLTRIFEPHFHRDGSGDDIGSGLGLATVSRLVRQLEWSVAASNEPSGGARFEVAIPPNWRASDDGKSAAS